MLQLAFVPADHNGTDPGEFSNREDVVDLRLARSLTQRQHDP